MYTQYIHVCLPLEDHATLSQGGSLEQSPENAKLTTLDGASFVGFPLYEGHSKNTWTMSLPFNFFVRN
jgi:hypothetical protein